MPAVGALTGHSACSRLLLPLLLTVACDLRYPEVAITNSTSPFVELRGLSFSGCAWDEVLAYGESTPPARCLTGQDRVHFKRLDAAAYCRDQAERANIDGVCACDGGVPEKGLDAGTNNQTPTWFNYQTISSHQVSYGGFYLFQITLDDMEQDFAVPGPYGHQ